ncbi:hypothetical protein [Viridibacillus arvi]|uniref:hypothetical protein n=1 Tax=Viridibacillus arvi TaxID=263475 RepID=UPI0034CD30AE
MNSSKYHKYEKWFFRFLFAFLALILPTLVLYVVDNESILYFIVSTILKVLLVASIASNFYLTKKTKQWMTQGRELTKEIGLQRLLLMEGNFLLPNRESRTRVIELHHYLGTLSEGKAYSKRDREEVINELKDQLKEDWRKLAEWKEQSEDDVLIVLTTHPGLKNLYERTCHPHFYITKSDCLFDPYVGMNLYEWGMATYLTSGRLELKPPKQWDSYYFYSPQTKQKGDN